MKIDDNIELKDLLDSFEKELVRNYKEVLLKLKIEIGKMFEKYGDDVDYTKMVMYHRLSNLESQIFEKIKKLTNENKKNVENAIHSSFRQSYEGAITKINESVPQINIAFGLLDEETIKAALLNPLDKIKWPERINKSSQKYAYDLKQTLTQGLMQGHGYGKMAKEFTRISEMDASRVLRIMRTEGHRAQTIGKLKALDRLDEAAAQLGLRTKRIWVSANDDRTRDSHKEMNGKAADENGYFTLPSGVTTAGPGLSGVAEEDINCRCRVISEIEGINELNNK